MSHQSHGAPCRYRRSAMSDQNASTTPKGHAPDKKPYTLDNTHPTAKPATKTLPRFSRAYIATMKPTATTPKTVITTSRGWG